MISFRLLGHWVRDCGQLIESVLQAGILSPKRLHGRADDHFSGYILEVVRRFTSLSAASGGAAVRAAALPTVVKKFFDSFVGLLPG
ncbi:MAG: hypothetical protein HYY23_17580 [Verrucomicrobia bacterium]|nr:hypothetical protein [Verrucomicrobiota bacterium]